MGNDAVVYLTDLEHERWLQDQYLDKFADPSVMVGRTVERRERGDTGIPVPWSKLHGCTASPVVASPSLGATQARTSQRWQTRCVHAASCGKRVAIASLELPADYVFEMMAEQAAVVPARTRNTCRSLPSGLTSASSLLTRRRCLSLWT